MDSYLALVLSDNKVLTSLRQFEEVNPNLFPKGDLKIKGLGKMERRTIIFMNYEWETLTYVRNLQLKYPHSIRVYFLFGEITSFEEYIPQSSIKGSNWMSAKNGRKLSDVPKYLGIPIEELREEVGKDKKNMLKEIIKLQKNLE